MKKSMIIIKALLLLVTVSACGLVQAQQQKPSERSFAAEVNKIKEKQAARNAMIRRMQQPTGNTTTPTNILNEQPVKSPASATSASNTTIPQQNSQPAVAPTAPQQTGAKPSSGGMRQPPRPRVQQ